MKKTIVGFVLGILFASAISFAAFTYKKTVMETWTGILGPGERLITVNSTCTRVRVYPATARMTDVKMDDDETMRITMILKK